MGTYGEQMKGVLSWLIRWARRAGTRDFHLALAFLLTVHYFNLCVPIAEQPSLAGSRAGPPVSECVSPGEI